MAATKKEEGETAGKEKGEEEEAGEDKELDSLLAELSHQKDSTTVAAAAMAARASDETKSAPEWSAVDTTDVSDFRALVPTMAIEYPFELDDFQKHLEVLKALGYVSPDLTVELKGRVAREISTCNEVVLTEMIFKNVFTPC